MFDFVYAISIDAATLELGGRTYRCVLTERGDFPRPQIRSEIDVRVIRNLLSAPGSPAQDAAGLVLGCASVGLRVRVPAATGRRTLGYC